MGATYSKIKRSTIRAENTLHRAVQDGDVVSVRKLTLTDEHVRKMSDRAPVPFTWHDWTDSGRALALGREPQGLNTPLHLAMQLGHWRIAQQLLFPDNNPPDQSKIKNRSGKTPWDYVLGFNSGKRDPETRYAAVHLCATHGPPRLLEQLLVLHPDSSTWKGVRFGETALHYLVKGDKDASQMEKAKILLKHDSDCIRYVSSKGWTPLAYAVSEDNVDLLKLFIAHELSHPTSEKFPTKAYSIRSTGINSIFSSGIDADPAPVFKVKSAEAVSAFLDAGIEELELTRNIDGAPLLHVCIMRKMLTSEIARKLASQSGLEWRGMLPVDLALRVNDSIAAFNLMDLRLRALREGINLDESKMTKRPEGFFQEDLFEFWFLEQPSVLALFSGWDNDLMRCEVFKKLMKDTDHAVLLKLMHRNIVRCVCVGGHVRLLEEVIRLLDVKARDLNSLTPGWGWRSRSPPLWIAADNGNVDQVWRLLELGSGGGEAVMDRPAPDGTTAMAMAVGHMNAEIAALILTSENVEPKDKIRFMAEEVLRTESKGDNEAVESFKNALSQLVVGDPKINTASECHQNVMDFEMVELSKRFPYVNEEAEIQRAVNKSGLDKMLSLGERKRIYVNSDLRNLILGHFCISCHSEDFWNISAVTIVDCVHQSDISMRKNCQMIHDLVRLAKQLESELARASPTMALLRPRFVLVGSVAEGTRIGLGNELDLTVTFDGWDDDQPPFKVDPGDPFHLKATDFIPEWMGPFFDAEGRFHFNKFLAEFFGALQSSVAAIFDCGKPPERLRRVTRNEYLLPKSCSECMANYDTKGFFVQCAACAVTVSQTKMGACLQFEWSDAKVYCSVDLVPTFKVEAVKAVGLARIVNVAMLAEDHPASWFDYLRGYAKGDRDDVLEMTIQGDPSPRGPGLGWLGFGMFHRPLGCTATPVEHTKSKSTPPGSARIVEEIYWNDHTIEEGNEINSVLLKTMTEGTGERYYFVRPGQRLRREKFLSKTLRLTYCRVKALKKILGLDGLSLYMVKKQLMRPAFLRLEKECDSNLGDFFFFALSQPELKAKFEARVDFAKWGEAKDAAAREAGAVHAPSEWIPLRRRSGFGPLNPAHVVFEGVYNN